MEIKKPRGTVDYFSLTDPSMEYVKNICSMIAKLNGCSSIETPIFEHQELFVRSVGETSDIVTKEYYCFKDKSDRSLALRPEMTASVMRAVIENKMFFTHPLPLKFFYVAPMFRYERPQSGRQRQFYQFGVEFLGSDSFYDDADIICFAISILQAFHCDNWILKINNICSFETRKKWIEALKKYFSNFKDKLTEDSLNRLNTNPLRILDDKIDGKKDFVKKAAKINEFATKEEMQYFDNLLNVLKQLNISYDVDETLVRGLDYYSNFVFEVVSLSKNLEGQSTLIGGGRYNSLAKELGSKQDVNCVGFALGLDRLIVALKDDKKFIEKINKFNEIDAEIACLDQNAFSVAILIAKILRNSGITTLINCNTTKLEKNFKYAQANKAKNVIIIGLKELEKNVVIVKDQKTLKQEEVKIDNLTKYLLNKR